MRIAWALCLGLGYGVVICSVLDMRESVVRNWRAWLLLIAFLAAHELGRVRGY